METLYLRLQPFHVAQGDVIANPGEVVAQAPYPYFPSPHPAYKGIPIHKYRQRQGTHAWKRLVFLENDDDFLLIALTGPAKIQSRNPQVSRSIIFLLSGSISLYGSAEQPSLEIHDEFDHESMHKDADKKPLVTILPGIFACHFIGLHYQAGRAFLVQMKKGGDEGPQDLW